MSFTTLLVANRGEIARRVFRSARLLGLRCAAVYVDADADAPFVTDADVAVRLPGSYLDGQSIIAATKLVGAEAIHPGYGFLSENADFAQAVLDAGLVFVGPTPAAIGAMGDKLAAKAVAQRLGVPTLTFTDDPANAEAVGYPVLVKAAAGGGGKGMRVVSDPADLAEAVAAARREAQHAFGDPTVFLEHYVEQSRHIEIQILGDTHGNLVHLGERECSIQRRHQKLVEESPSPFLTPERRAQMGDAALRLAREIGYSSAGTVEFLVDDDTGEFFFLEVNARLQVEHPVTEEVTGIDLVAAQLHIAEGAPLPFTQADVVARGHSIEVRLCAEDAESGFLPATGTLAAFEPARGTNLRVESGVVAGSHVTVNFDPMLAKLIATAPTRVEAARALARSLEQLHLGGVTTNRDFLVATLRHPAFLKGATTTDFIDQHRAELISGLEPAQLQRAARVGALWLRDYHHRHAPVLRATPAGWRNARLPLESITFRHGATDHEVRYGWRRDGRVTVDDDVATIYRSSDDEIDLEIGGVRTVHRVTMSHGHLYVQLPTTTVDLALVPRFTVPGTDAVAGGLVAPMPGTILSIRVAMGDVVTKGDTIIVMEAMKMEHHIAAPADGQVVDILVEEGQQVENGAPLIVLDEVELAAEDEGS